MVAKTRKAPYSPFNIHFIIPHSTAQNSLVRFCIVFLLCSAKELTINLILQEIKLTLYLGAFNTQMIVITMAFHGECVRLLNLISIQCSAIHKNSSRHGLMFIQ